MTATDAGRTWGEPFLVNTDGTKAEHGLVSFAATEKGMGVVWLDGRETKGAGSHMAIIRRAAPVTALSRAPWEEARKGREGLISRTEPSVLNPREETLERG